VVLALLAVAGIAAACSSTPSSPSSSADSLITQGLQAESSNQLSQAAKDFMSAAQKDPADAVAWYDLGDLYQVRLAQNALAENAYNKALLAAPDYRSAMFNLAILETNSNPQGAISLYDQLIKLNPNDANSNFNLGLLLISQGQTTQGQAALTKAIFLNPKLKSRVPAGITP
jgi:tetratricopeptide (TPR) repeat protein